MIHEIFELNPVVDDPRYEGFALTSEPSILGRDSLDDDLTPGFAEAEERVDWQQPSLAEKWKPPKVAGRVAEFNDYPCVDMVLPAFSSRAVDALRSMLEENGELLELNSSTKTKYFLYNILTISDALDRSRSHCDFWCEPPTTATEIEHFEFDSQKVSKLSVFRIRELPASVFVTSRFVEKVVYFGLKGFDFKKVWPLPKGMNWRMQKSFDDAELKTLKRETLVVVLPIDKSSNLAGQINRLEASVDAKLRVESPTEKYFGAYEGHDVLDGTYRMFFSAPNANILFERIQQLILSYEWPKPIVVHLRNGRLYDNNVREETLMI